MNDDPRPPDDLEARFDAALASAARRLVTEELPRGVLDVGLAPGVGSGSVRTRRTAPAFAGVAAALVLLLASLIALTPGGVPSASSTPSQASTPTAQPEAPGPSPSGSTTPSGTFRSTAEIRADLEGLGYTCREGGVLLPRGPSPSAPVLEGAICSAPADAGPYIASVIVSEARDGAAVQLDVKADLTGEDSPAAREAIAAPLAKAVAIAVSGQGTGDRLAAWVLDAVPVLVQDSGNSTNLDGFAVKIVRNSTGTYQLFLRPG